LNIALYLNRCHCPAASAEQSILAFEIPEPQPIHQIAMSGQGSYLDDAAAATQGGQWPDTHGQGGSQTKITMHVDIISPFGYLAFYMLNVS